MGTAEHERSDEDLLLAARDEPEAFGLFYRRTCARWRVLLAAQPRRRGDGRSHGGDLRRRPRRLRALRSGRGPAIGWLYGIAHRQLARCTAAAPPSRARDGAWGWPACSSMTRSSSASRPTPCSRDHRRGCSRSSSSFRPNSGRPSRHAYFYAQLVDARRRRATGATRGRLWQAYVGRRVGVLSAVCAALVILIGGLLCCRRHCGLRPRRGRRQRGADAGESHPCARGADGRGRAGTAYGSRCSTARRSRGRRGRSQTFCNGGARGSRTSTPPPTRRSRVRPSGIDVVRGHRRVRSHAPSASARSRR